MMEITAEIRALIDKAAASMELAGDEFGSVNRVLYSRSMKRISCEFFMINPPKICTSA